MAEQKSAVAPPAAPKSNFVASVANFSVQYNLSCAAIALEIMKSDHGVKIPDDDTGAVSPHTPDFAEPAWADKTLLGMVFAGAVMGMVGMGYLGDVIGRRRALLLTLGFIIVGALGSGLFSWGADGTVYGVICACRILTGIGVGGIYPLSASEASEGSAADEHAGTRVGWAFFWQTPGAMAPYVIAWLMLVGHPSYAAIARPSSLLFRLLFVIGAVPAAVVWRAAYLEPENEACARARKKAAGTGGASPLREALAHPEYFKTLVGTGGTWFIYDIAYYGIGIFTPNILNNIFGKGETLIDLCWQSLAVSAVGLPGAVAAIVLLERLGSKKENLYGFLLIAACFAAMAVVYTAAPDQHWLLFFLFCCLTFALNFGPNVATFVLPATAFPVHVRSTFHGLSAGSGKVGAVIGTFMYQPLADAYGSATVMWVQCVLCVCGALISHYFIADDAEKHGGSGGGLGGRNVLGGGGGGGAVGQLNEALLEGGAREERGRGGH